MAPVAVKYGLNFIAIGILTAARTAARMSR